MDCLNCVTLTGFVERTPPMKFDAESGAQLTTCTVRMEEPGKDGAVCKVCVFIECYGRVAEKAGAVNAGDLVGIEGRLKWRSYTDRDGQKKGTLAVLARQVNVLLPACLPPQFRLAYQLEQSIAYCIVAQLPALPAARRPPSRPGIVRRRTGQRVVLTGNGSDAGTG